MSFGDLVRKMERSGFRQHRMIFLAIAFGVALSGANGILQFSPTVTRVLITDGSTYQIAMGMYLLSLIGTATFFVYLNTVYQKSKISEHGILLSLGLPKKAVARLAGREFAYLYLSSVIVVLALSVPISWLSWWFLTLFLSTAETSYQIGYPGIGIAAVLALALGLILWRLNRRKILKLDVIAIFQVKEEQEVKRGESFIPGLLGILMVPIGLILFRWSSYTDHILGKIPFAFILLSVAGLFLVSAQITRICNLVKRYFPKLYCRQLLFLNLIRQKGKQYTLTLFVACILVAITIFGLSFNSAAFTEAGYAIEQAPYDYFCLLGDQEAGLVNQNSVMEC